MSLILRVAVQHEAIRDNSVRNLDPIEAGSGKPRALTLKERRHFLTWTHGTSGDKEEAGAQASARRRDLPDIVTFMLGTGVRIGEALGSAGATSTSKACPSSKVTPLGGPPGCPRAAAGGGPRVRGGPVRGSRARSCWFTNVRSCVAEGDWERLRRPILRRVGYRCEACGAAEERAVGRGWRWMSAGTTTPPPPCSPCDGPSDRRSRWPGGTGCAGSQRDRTRADPVTSAVVTVVGRRAGPIGR